MKLFDLHCDTITELTLKKEDLAYNDLAVSLEKGRLFEQWIQLYAIWMPDDLRGPQAVDYYEYAWAYFIHQADAVRDRFRILQRKGLSDLPIGCPAGILAIEGGSAVCGSVERLEKVYEDGVRLMTLTWNGENELGYGISEDKGLKPAGKAVVKQMEALGMVVDVSHLAPAGFYDVAGMASRPFVASHSNAKAICAHPRNLTDEQFKLIVQSRGIVGLNFYKRFVKESALPPTMEDLIPHLDHFLSLGGEDAVCIGSDFDGCDPVCGLSGLGDMESFFELVCSRYGNVLADKFFFKNAYHFFKKYI